MLKFYVYLIYVFTNKCITIINYDFVRSIYHYNISLYSNNNNLKQKIYNLLYF